MSMLNLYWHWILAIVDYSILKNSSILKNIFSNKHNTTQYKSKKCYLPFNVKERQTTCHDHDCKRNEEVYV